MRVIKKSEVREIIIGHVEFTLIFLFDDFLCKIAILEPLKVRFLDKKQKLLSDDGIPKFFFKIIFLQPGPRYILNAEQEQRLVNPIPSHYNTSRLLLL